jgi:hypothetical protein
MDFKPAGITAEGTFTPDLLIAGDHPIRTAGVTLKTTLDLKRGTVLYLKTGGDTQYEAFDGGTPLAGSLLGILVEDVNTAGGAASVMVYIAGDFNTNSLIFATGGTAAAVRERLALQSLYLRDAVAA